MQTFLEHYLDAMRKEKAKSYRKPKGWRKHEEEAKERRERYLKERERKHYV